MKNPVSGRTRAQRTETEDRKEQVGPKIDEALLEILVCPLSKKPLRFDAETNELINEELGIAYPILDGIPNMIPQEARLLQKDASTADGVQPVCEHVLSVHDGGTGPHRVPLRFVLLGAVDENFPQGCTSSSSLCFYSLLLPVTIPVYVFFHLWSWIGIKLFRHN
ncbi:unnamed protein product [Pleuronectes platessa]|uniref:Protein preY, mitochondrial n=1 Tax=Pleuronectes platessa TaxID=8262 RepID=A0A9N7YBK1_PLEPL|nr:unnamed protein product [Pleuronectes platessa]